MVIFDYFGYHKNFVIFSNNKFTRLVDSLPSNFEIYVYISGRYIFGFFHN